MIRRPLTALLILLGVFAATASATTPSATDLTRLPIGDNKLSTTAAQKGYVYRCGIGHDGGGAQTDGPWIDSASGTFNERAKAIVDGQVAWSSAAVAFTQSASGLTVTGNGLPVGYTTGTFPIASTDDAYAYDRNPNSIKAQTVNMTLPSPATPATSPGCISSSVGVALDGVQILDGLDALGRDAVAHETQDACSGHPQMSGIYHYHSEPLCFTDAEPADQPSGQFGWALDGYPIMGPRGAGGKLYTNDDLDECHGTTSAITLNGQSVTMYHYVATYEFPYTVGCFHGKTGTGGSATPTGSSTPAPTATATATATVRPVATGTATATPSPTPTAAVKPLKVTFVYLTRHRLTASLNRAATLRAKLCHHGHCRTLTGELAQAGTVRLRLTPRLELGRWSIKLTARTAGDTDRAKDSVRFS